MNYFYLTFLIVSISSYSLFANNKIEKYYYLVNKAELQIVNMKYDNALNIYNKAFFLKKVNYKDLYNAFLCAYYTNDTFYSIKYNTELAKNGLQKLFFQDSMFNYQFYLLIYKNYDSIYNHFDNYRYKYSQLESAYKTDQLVRNIDTFQQYTILKADSINLNIIYYFIKKYGISVFQKLGMWNSLNGPLINNDAFFLVMWHNSFTNHPIQYKLDKLLKKAVEKGFLDPAIYLTLNFGRTNKLMSENECKEDIYFTKIWGYEKLDKVKINEINLIRNEIYLESIEDYKIKYDYQSIHHERFGVTKKNMFCIVNSFLIVDQVLIDSGYFK
jgi:hypothetical protein